MRLLKRLTTAISTTLLSAAVTVASVTQDAKIEVHTTDSHGAWYTQPVWIAIGIIALVLILVLISLASRRGRTTIVK